MARTSHVLAPWTLLLQRLRQGRWPAIELPPEILWFTTHLPQERASLLLAVYSALPPDHACILAPKDMCLLRVPRAGMLVQPLEIPAFLVEEGLVVPSRLGWPGGSGKPVVAASCHSSCNEGG